MRFILTTVIGLGFVGFLPAQNDGGSGSLSTNKPLSDLQTYLALTDVQVSSLESVQQQYQTAVSHIYAQITQKYQALHSLEQASSPDPLAIGQTLIDILNLQKQLQQLSTDTYHSQALAVLTQTQAAQLGNLSAAIKLLPAAYEAESVFLIPALGCIGLQPQPLAAISSPSLWCPAPPVGFVSAQPGTTANALPSQSPRFVQMPIR
jgi:Spy/CpxP family protein refolding chaperone